jgi:hypothetical protein
MDIVENVGAALVAAHGKHKKSSLPMGSHKGGPYIIFIRLYTIRFLQPRRGVMIVANATHTFLAP